MKKKKKKLPANAGDAGLTQVPWVGKIPWRRKRQLTPVFLLGKSHGPRSPVGYSSRGCKKRWDIVAAGFPGCSASNESACIAGDPGSIPGSGRSAGEGIGYPVQYFWASLIAQTVKNLLAMGEIWIQSLGWEDPLEKGTCYPLQYSGLENSMDGGASQATGGRKESDMTE